MTSSRRDILKAAAATSLLTLPGLTKPARAQADYPNRNITVISMFQAGTAPDITIRWYAEQLAKRIGRPVVVENKVGANGMIGVQQVAVARPDGYTLSIVPGSSVLAAAPHLYKSVPYDPVKDFESVTTLCRATFILCVDAKSPYQTLAQLTAALREKGDKASYGSLNNVGLIASELYKNAFNLKVAEVPYRDTQAGVNDLVGGQIEFFHISAGGAIALVNSRQVRPLVTSSVERLAAMPDVPGAAEAGIPNSDLWAWWSVHAPAKTPTPIIDKLEAVFNEIVASKEAQEFVDRMGLVSYPGNRKLVDQILVKDLNTWPEYVRIAKLQKI